MPDAKPHVRSRMSTVALVRIPRSGVRPPRPSGLGNRHGHSTCCIQHESGILHFGSPPPTRRARVLTASTRSPRLSAFFSPTPGTPSSASCVAGRSRARCCSVLSWKITYGGTCRSRASSRRSARSASKSARSVIAQGRRRGGRCAPPSGLRAGGAQRARLAIQDGLTVAAEQRDALGRELQGRVLLAGPREHARLRELIDVAANLRDRTLLEQAVRAQLLVPARQHRLGGIAVQDGRNVGHAEPLADARHARQDLAGDDDRFLDALELAEAPVARAARPARRIRLAEVLDQRAVAAVRRGGVALHLAQVLSVAVAQLVVRFEQALPAQEVGRRRDQDALGRQAVAARASGLLLVVLQRSRRAGVDHEPDVRAVDAHAERHRGHDDVGSLVDERLLVRVARRRRSCPRGRAAPARPAPAATPPSRRPRGGTGSR